MAVRAQPPPARRDARPVAAVVGGISGVALLALAFLLWNPGGQPGATSTVRPTATSTAVAASQSVESSASPTITPAQTSTGLPSAPPSTAPPTATPTASPEPSPLGRAPMREIVFTSLGIDNPLAPETTPRQLTFNVDGRGAISATVSNISAGLVKMCFIPGPSATPPVPPDAFDCVVTPDDTIRAEAQHAGPWTLVLTGEQPGRSPAITLLLRWPSNSPQLQLTDFRFQGQDSPNYTGFDLKLTALADGQLDMVASWDDGFGGSYPYDLSVLDLSVEFEEPVFVEGISHLAAVQRDVLTEHTYQIVINNRQDLIIPAVFLQSTITWP